MRGEKQGDYGDLNLTTQRICAAQAACAALLQIREGAEKSILPVPPRFRRGKTGRLYCFSPRKFTKIDFRVEGVPVLWRWNLAQQKG